MLSACFEHVLAWLTGLCGVGGKKTLRGNKKGKSVFSGYKSTDSFSLTDENLRDWVVIPAGIFSY